MAVVTVVSFDGTKCCIQKVENGGEVVESSCFPCKTVKIEGKCVLEGYSDRPGFVLTCEGEARVEGDVIVLSS